MRFTYSVTNPLVSCTGDAATLEQAIAGVGFCVRTQGAWNHRQRFTWEIESHEESPSKDPGMTIERTRPCGRGTMTYRQAGGK